MGAAARELDALLREHPPHAHERALHHVTVTGDAAVILYGAGVQGRSVLKRLRRAGLEPVAFADDTPEKQGCSIDGVTVTRPADAAARYGRRALFVFSMLNPRLPFVEARRRLQQLTDAPIVSAAQLAWAYPASFLPFANVALPEDVLAESDAIARVFNLLADEESRRQFVAHLRFRLHLDYDALPASAAHGYFPDLLPPLPDNVIFVDGGAYDGDSIREFLAHQQMRFGRIHAFEPDARNFAKLADYVGGLPGDLRAKIVMHQTAMGERRSTVAFNQTGDSSAAVSADGSTDVESVPLDEVLHDAAATVYIKLDVEGAEAMALRGARRVLTRHRPLLAISVYHTPTDLWRLPAEIHALDLGYRLFLRTQGVDGTDVVCYAIAGAS